MHLIKKKKTPPKLEGTWRVQNRQSCKNSSVVKVISAKCLATWQERTQHQFCGHLSANTSPCLFTNSDSGFLEYYRQNYEAQFCLKSWLIKEVSSFNKLLWQFTHSIIYTVNQHSLNANQQMLAAVNGQQKKKKVMRSHSRSSWSSLTSRTDSFYPNNHQNKCKNCICSSVIKWCTCATRVPNWGFDPIEKVPQGLPEKVMLDWDWIEPVGVNYVRKRRKCVPGSRNCMYKADSMLV